MAAVSLSPQHDQADHGERVTVRIPAPLAGELRGIAERDANSVSAVVKRLLSASLRREGVARG